MEGGDSILDSIFDKDNCEDFEDVEMLDAEEGELVEPNVRTEMGQSSCGDINLTTQESQSKNQRRRNKKKKHKRKKSSNSGPNVTDINRFVLDVCRRLKERKSYLVDAIQACGGQKTADGRRYRTGGGILWGILKVRDPNAYKEIMKKGNEFEKQLKQGVKHGSSQTKATPSEGEPLVSTAQSISSLNSSQLIPDIQKQPELSFIDQKRPSVHDRIRVPVAYDDLVGVEDLKDGTQVD